MAQANDTKSPLLELPLELRHKIYGFSSQRRNPKLIIKEYLEKIVVVELQPCSKI